MAWNFGMLIYDNLTTFQSWLDYGQGLLIFLIFVMSAPWLRALHTVAVLEPQMEQFIYSPVRQFESNLSKINKLVAAIKSLRFALFQIK